MPICTNTIAALAHARDPATRRCWLSEMAMLLALSVVSALIVPDYASLLIVHLS
jgi:hypothetical protein